MTKPTRLNIYMANLPSVGGSVQNGKRPVIIMQSDFLNQRSSTTVVIPLTSQHKKEMSTHVNIGHDYGLEKESVALCEQLQTIDMSRLCERLGEIDDPYMIAQIYEAIYVTLELKDGYIPKKLQKEMQIDDG